MTQVKVEGLNESVRALRAIGDGLPRELGRIHRDIGNQAAEDARSAAVSLGGVSRHVAPSIKGLGSSTRETVTIGGPGWPMAGGAEFGAFHNLPRRTSRGTVLGWNQFPARSTEGRIVGRTLRRKVEVYDREYERRATAFMERVLGRS